MRVKTMFSPSFSTPFSGACGLFIFLLVIGSFAFDGDVQYLGTSDYYPSLKMEIDKARTSVVAAVYIFALYPERQDALTTHLAAALVAAKKRGCSVRIILDNGGNDGPLGEDGVNANNRSAYQYLSAFGLDMCFADVPTSTVMHGKAVVIDSNVVFVGSHNWSEAAFSKNVEMGVVVRSAEIAKKALMDIAKIPTMVMPARDSTVAARLPVRFLTDTTLFGRMVSESRENVFDIYLYCLKSSFRQPDSTFVLHYDSLIHYLGMDSLDVVRTRSLINIHLKILQDTFKLIARTLHKEKDADVRITPLAGDCMEIPAAYFKWGWNRHLDFPAKVMEMLSLYYSSTSHTRPKWSLRVKTIAAWHGISKFTVSAGVEQLRHKNLIDVGYSEYKGRSEDERHPNIYLPLPFYDPAVLTVKLANLEKKYGKEKTDRARGYAELVFKDCDPAAVETIIENENQYGIDKMAKAAKVIAAMVTHNPHRSLDYFLGIVRTPDR
jgi:hypothetical protein